MDKLESRQQPTIGYSSILFHVRMDLAKLSLSRDNNAIAKRLYIDNAKGGGGEPIMITDVIADELSFERLHPTRYDEVKMMPFCMPE